MREYLATPSEKRYKLDPYFNEENGPNDSDSSEEEKEDQEGENADAASSASRKKRGLKILSVKV
jgi:hypothetical protein